MLTLTENSIMLLGVSVARLQNLYPSKVRAKRLRSDVDNPIIQPNAINVVDVIKFEQDTCKGNGGLQNVTVSNAQQSLGMSDDNRYREGRE